MIDTDTRQLRLTSDGFVAGAGKKVCDHCGFIAACPISGRQVSCFDFLPTLPFTDETGMSAVFNTVRIGKAWPKRLNDRDHIALYNPKTAIIFGHATVLQMFTGSIRSILANHAHANHLMLDKEPGDAAELLFKWQRQNYGPRIVHEDASLTAIYLLRDRKPPAAPDLTR